MEGFIFIFLFPKPKYVSHSEYLTVFWYLYFRTLYDGSMGGILLAAPPIFSRKRDYQKCLFWRCEFYARYILLLTSSVHLHRMEKWKIYLYRPHRMTGSSPFFASVFYHRQLQSLSCMRDIWIFSDSLFENTKKTSPHGKIPWCGRSSVSHSSTDWILWSASGWANIWNTLWFSFFHCLHQQRKHCPGRYLKISSSSRIRPRNCLTRLFPAKPCQKRQHSIRIDCLCWYGNLWGNCFSVWVSQ